MLGKAADNTRRSGNGFWRPRLGRDAAMLFEGPSGSVDFPAWTFRVDLPRGLSAWTFRVEPLGRCSLKDSRKMTRAKYTCSELEAFESRS